MAKAPQATDSIVSQPPVCGIIMPISSMPGRDAAHWSDVRKVIDAAIIKAGMSPQIVSDSFESDVIQSRIINNLYNNPVVVCDVSGLNPNVMFELGMRITFKQPVVIVTDDIASVPFDTKVIDHLGYPQDLHIHHTNEFIERLSERISRLLAQKKEGAFKSFIEAFGTYDVLEPTTKVVGAEELILEKLDQLTRSVDRQRSDARMQDIFKRIVPASPDSEVLSHFQIRDPKSTHDERREAIKKIRGVTHFEETDLSDGGILVTVGFKSPTARDEVAENVITLLSRMGKFVRPNRNS